MVNTRETVASTGHYNFHHDDGSEVQRQPPQALLRAGPDATPGPVSDARQEGEHEVELLLNRGARRDALPGPLGRRWLGHTSADDEWLQL